MKKSRSTRSHFTHARSCSRALNQVPTRAKQPASIRKYSLWKGDIFSFDRFTGYTKSNQNQFGRVLPFAFALTCFKIYLFFSSLSDFDSFSWRVHLCYGVCRLRARVQLKTLSSLLKFEIRLNQPRWPIEFVQNCAFSTGQYRKKGTCLDFIFTRFVIYPLVILLRPGSGAVLHMSRIECKWGRTKDFAHLHSIRLMWSTASKLGLS